MSNSRPLTVTELTSKVKNAITMAVGPCWIEGEISGFRGDANSSGHRYFSLKDSSSSVSAAIFANSEAAKTVAEGLTIADGKLVRAYGEISVYGPRGTYSFIIRKIQAAGLGEMMVRLEELKKKLAQEGVFDPENKPKLPFLPRHIGIISSPTGAVIHDILKVAMRRFPNIHMTLAPAVVQGEKAAESICRALDFFNGISASSCIDPVDLIIVARGGGSFEDLMPFNDENLVRSVASSRIPVISSIGHQTDITLCDLAAAVRAATPSEAAERAVPEKSVLQMRIAKLASSISVCANRRLDIAKTKLTAVGSSVFFKQPKRMVESLAMRVDAAESTLNGLRKTRLAAVGAEVSQMLPRMQRALRAALQEATRKCSEEERNLKRAFITAADIRRRNLNTQRDRLAAYSPLATLRRGYTITFNEQGQVVNSAEAALQCRILFTRFADGVVESSVRSDSGKTGTGRAAKSNVDG